MSAEENVESEKNEEVVVVVEEIKPEPLEPTEPTVEIKKEEIIPDLTADYTQENIGRLKRTLSEKCPVCGKPLQLRVREIESLLRGETVIDEETYKKCSVCDFTEEIKNQKKRKRVFDKTKMVKEDLVVDDRKDRKGGNNDRYKQRERSSSNSRTNDERSVGGYSRGSNRNIPKRLPPKTRL